MFKAFVIAAAALVAVSGVSANPEKIKEINSDLVQIPQCARDCLAAQNVQLPASINGTTVDNFCNQPTAALDTAKLTQCLTASTECANKLQDLTVLVTKIETSCSVFVKPTGTASAGASATATATATAAPVTPEKVSEINRELGLIPTCARNCLQAQNYTLPSNVTAENLVAFCNQPLNIDQTVLTQCIMGDEECSKKGADLYTLFTSVSSSCAPYLKSSNSTNANATSTATGVSATIKPTTPVNTNQGGNSNSGVAALGANMVVALVAVAIAALSA
ncbi:hypothetical protein HDU97_007864 [Phlyctochytrium planicorne]|nr:hypothetical protein HDU97_007864 [Phlyctochytrium planicorne]